MLASGTNQTLWEEWWLDAMGRSGKLQKGRTRSDAQTESAFPPALFAEFLVGVEPKTPGLKEVFISYKKTSLSHIHAIIPSPVGNLEVEWNVSEKKGSLDLHIPVGMIVHLDVESLRVKGNREITVNGKSVLVNKVTKQYLALKVGKQVVDF